MDPHIQPNRTAYVDDVEGWLSLKNRLPTAVAVSALVHTIFGQNSKVVESGLMTDYQ